MYTTLDTIPDNVKASLDSNMQKQWVSVYNQTIKKGGPHRNAIFKAWESVKADPSCRYFSGFVSTNRIDKQNDSVDVTGAFKKISAFIERGGFITDTHSNRLVGSFYNAELRKSPSGSDGVYAYGVIFRGEPYFDSTWSAIKKSAECPSCHDVRKGTSIGGFALDTKMACNGSQCHRDILDLSIHEISVCQDPANPDAIIDQFNRFAKSDSTVPDGSDVMKKALVQEEFVEEPVGEAPFNTNEEMIDAANMGASEAEGMIQEEAGGPAPEGLAGATQALSEANSASTDEGRVPTVEEIKEFKMQLKNIDKLIREISSIRDIIDGAEGGSDGLVAGGTPGGAPEGGATEVANKSMSEVNKRGANGRETWEEAQFSDDFPNDREGGIGPSRYNRMRAANAKRDAPANAVGGALNYGIKQMGNAFDIASDPTKAIDVTAQNIGGMADAAQKKGLKMDYERWRKGEKNPNGYLNDVPDAPDTKKAPNGAGEGMHSNPAATGNGNQQPAATGVEAPGIGQSDTYGKMDAERDQPEAEVEPEPSSGTGEISFGAPTVGSAGKPKPNPNEKTASASKLTKGCGCGMDKEIHTGIEEKTCKMPKELYGDETDQQKTKFVDHKAAEAEKYPEADKDAGLVGAPELKGKKTAKAGPAVETKVVKKLPAEEYAKSNDFKAHIKGDIKEEKKIMNIANDMKKEDEEELEKCKSSKEFLSQYGPKNHPEQNNSSKGTRVKAMGNEGKEIFMKAVEEAFDELNGDEDMYEEDADVDNFVEGAEEAVEEHEQEELMTAQELIGMVLGFLKEKGIQVDLGDSPLANPQIEDEIEKEPGVTEEEINILSASPQMMEDAECLGKIAMYKFNARFTENRINLMDNKILERLEKGNYVDEVSHEMQHAAQPAKAKKTKGKASEAPQAEKDAMWAEKDPSKSKYAKSMTDMEFCEGLVKAFDKKKEDAVQHEAQHSAQHLANAQKERDLKDIQNNSKSYQSRMGPNPQYLVDAANAKRAADKEARTPPKSRQSTITIGQTPKVDINKKKINKALTDLEFCEELVKAFEMRKGINDDIDGGPQAPAEESVSNSFNTHRTRQAPQSPIKPKQTQPQQTTPASAIPPASAPTPQPTVQHNVTTAKPTTDPIFPGINPSHARTETNKVPIPETPKEKDGIVHSDGRGGISFSTSHDVPAEHSYTVNGKNTNVNPAVSQVRKPTQTRKPNLYQRARNVKRKAFNAPGKAAKKVGDWKSRVTAEYPGYEASFSSLESINHYNEIRKAIEEKKE